jgi:hypothetical protein
MNGKEEKKCRQVGRKTKIFARLCGDELVRNLFVEYKHEIASRVTSEARCANKHPIETSKCENFGFTLERARWHA